MSKQTHRMGKKSPVKILKGLEVQIFKITGMFYCKKASSSGYKTELLAFIYLKTTILQIAAGATFILLLHII
jgi:hypothetical protein